MPLYGGHRFEIHAHFWPDDVEEAELPAALAPALGQLARGCTIDAVRAQRSGLDESQLEFVASVQAVMRERPLYRALLDEPAQ